MKTTVLGTKYVLQAYFYFCKNLKLCLEIKAGQVTRLVHQQELGWFTRFVEANVLFSKASRRVLLIIQPPVSGHRAASPLGHEAYLSVPRLKCVKLYLHLTIRILGLRLISRGYLYCFPKFLRFFLWKISRFRISSTCHVVLRITLCLSSALDGRAATVVARRFYLTLSVQTRYEWQIKGRVVVS